MSSADVNGIKMFLNSWLGKRKLGTPNYETRQENRGNSIRFKCELRVPNFPYTAIGNSTSKKDAMTNAAMDFCQYLVREGKLHASELPSMKNEFLESSLTESNAPGSSFFGHGAPAPAPAPRLPWSNNAYMRDEQGHKEHMAAIADDISQSEAVDLKAGLHGNWTAENSKAALNEFLQKMRLPAIVYKTQIKETNLTKTFVSEASVYLPNMMKNYTGRGQGSTKKYAESLCAANIVKQFFHLGIIQPYSGPRKKAETKTMPRIDVDVNPDLSERVRRFVENSGVAPVTVDVDSTTPEAPCSLLVDHKLAQFPDSEASVPSNVSWTPPLPNWNPWQCANIDAPPLSIMSLHEISEKISEKENAKLQMFEHQKMNEARKQLPVYQHRSRIIETVRDNQVTLIKGETGCGKSTQVAQYILESYVDDGRGAEFSAVVSQPRRISAISLAERVAAEKSEILGETVGYGVRFENVSPRPYGSIKFCTVGTLLRMMENGLRGISHVIIDEIHERDIDTDFVLIVLRDMISTFKHLRVILMSATIDTDLFTEYFNKCPIITMEGRTFAVKHFFLENIMQNLKFIPEAIISKKKKSADDEEEVDDKSRNMNLLEGGDVDPNLRLAMSRISEKEIPFDIIVEILKKINGDALPGAVLIFLPGWADIMTLLGMLSENPEFQDTSRYELLPLHSQLTSTDQRKVFDHYEQKRKIILSTNIAETSITIDDVVFVIDSCKVKERMYTSSNNMVHFATVWASKTNIVQRRGRAGRVSAGYAFHLCSTQRFNALDEHSTAEMLRIPLHQIALNIKLLRLGSVGGFLAKAIEPPPYDMVVESEAVLQNISALDKNLELTDLGRMLARLPIDPMIGKVLVLGSVLGIGSLMCDVASAMSFSTPFVPRERFHTRLSNQQRSFAGNKYSDHVALVAVTQAYRDAEQSGFQGAKGFCERYSLSQTVCKVTSGARRQLVDLLKFSCGFPEDCLYDIQIDPHGKDRNLDLMISLLITALYPNVCFYQEKRKVYTIEQAPALLSKFSVLMGVGVKDLKLPSPLLVFKEKVRTRCVSCKELSLVSPIQLMLFGSRKVECIGADTIRLDDMITLKMDVNVAALIVALRPSIEALLVRSCQNPQSLLNAPQGDHELKDLLCELSSEKLMAEAGAVEDVLLTTAAKGASQISMRPSRGAGAHNSWGFGDLGSGGLPPNNDAWNSGSSESSDAGGKIFSPPRFPTAAPHPYNGNYRGASAPPIAPWTPTEQGFGYNRGFSGGNGGFGGNRGFGGYRGSRGFSDGNRGFNSRGGYRGGQRGRFRGGNNWGF